MTIFENLGAEQQRQLVEDISKAPYAPGEHMTVEEFRAILDSMGSLYNLCVHKEMFVCATNDPHSQKYCKYWGEASCHKTCCYFRENINGACDNFRAHDALRLTNFF